MTLTVCGKPIKRPHYVALILWPFLPTRVTEDIVVLLRMEYLKMLIMRFIDDENYSAF